MLERLEILIGKDNIEKIKSKNILLIGLGGVGGYAFESLIRSGIENITIVDYDMRAALTAALIIAVVTFVICYIGVRIGRLLGDIVGSRASIVGGIILILIGLEIFVGHFLG